MTIKRGRIRLAGLCLNRVLVLLMTGVTIASAADPSLLSRGSLLSRDGSERVAGMSSTIGARDVWRAEYGREQQRAEKILATLLGLADPKLAAAASSVDAPTNIEQVDSTEKVMQIGPDPWLEFEPSKSTDAAKSFALRIGVDLLDETVFPALCLCVDAK